jgi:hypothetical protein
MKDKKKVDKKKKDEPKHLDMDGIEIVESAFLGNHKVVERTDKKENRLHGGLLD